MPFVLPFGLCLAAPPFPEQEIEVRRGRETGPGPPGGAPCPGCIRALSAGLPRALWEGFLSLGACPPAVAVRAKATSWPPYWDSPPGTEGGCAWPCVAPCRCQGRVLGEMPSGPALGRGQVGSCGQAGCGWSPSVGIIRTLVGVRRCVQLHPQGQVLGRSLRALFPLPGALPEALGLHVSVLPLSYLTPHMLYLVLLPQSSMADLEVPAAGVGL